jgi:hypothetical protein
MLAGRISGHDVKHLVLLGITLGLLVLGKQWYEGRRAAAST